MPYKIAKTAARLICFTCLAAAPSFADPLGVVAQSTSVLGEISNGEAAYVVVSVTKNGVPVQGLVEKDFQVDALVVGPGGALVNITGASDGGAPGFYVLNINPISGQTWKEGTYIFGVTVHHESDEGQTLTRLVFQPDKTDVQAAKPLPAHDLASQVATPLFQPSPPFSSPFAAMGGSTYGQAVGVTSIVFGDEPKGKPEVILFTGLLEITKSPAQKLANGLRQINLKFDSKLPNGALAARSAITSMGYVQVWVDPDRNSLGTLVEIPGHPHEAAQGHAELYLVFKGGPNFTGPDFGELRNREPVVLSSHIHNVPPITHPLKLRRGMSPDELIKMMDDVGGADKWVGANPYPLALYDSQGQIRAWFTPYVHVTTLTGVCGDGIDNDMDGRIDGFVRRICGRRQAPAVCQVHGTARFP